MRQSSILLSIPDTVLFVGGAPVKWIGTVADGRVGRRVMGREGGYRSQSGIGAGRFTNVSVNQISPLSYMYNPIPLVS